jgi:hypothetical protein
VLLAGETRHRDIERIEDQRGDSSLTEPRGAV